MKHRVVVTGLGLVTPLGNTVAATWAGLMAGRSGAGPVTKEPAQRLVYFSRRHSSWKNRAGALASAARR